MKKFAAALAASALAALALVAPASAASAAADPYAPTVCDVQVSSTEVRSGEPFTVTVTADLASIISVTFNGETKKSPSEVTTFEAEFIAPRVQSDRQYPVSVSCGTTDGSLAGVTVLGPGGGSDGDADADADGGSVNAAADSDTDAGDAAGILPGTGGTDFWLLVLGAGLVLAGLGTVVVRRRRS
jgi:LPXTG-motif cell wall-anchored protein